MPCSQVKSNKNPTSDQSEKMTNNDKVSRFSIVSSNEEPSVSSVCSMKTGVTQSLTGGNEVVRIYSKFPHYVPLACLALFMNPVLGLPAFLCALRSRHYQRTGQDGRAPKFSHWALWLSLNAIASSIIIVVIIIFYVVVFTPNIITSIPGLMDDDYDSFYVSNSTHYDIDDDITNTTLSQLH